MARIIVFVVFGGFGIVMLYVGLTQYLQQRRLLSSAQTVDAVITHSQVFSSVSADTDSRLGRSNSTTTHRPDVRFRYTVNRAEFESELLYPTSIARTFASSGDAAEALAPFPLNARVRAFVDPSQPSNAFLMVERSAAPVVFVVIGVLLPPVAWFVGRWIL